MGVAVGRDEAPGELQAGDAAVGGRVADRPAAVGADRSGHQPGPDRGAPSHRTTRRRSAPGPTGCRTGRRRRCGRSIPRRTRACWSRRRPRRPRRAGAGTPPTRPRRRRSGCGQTPSRGARQGSANMSLTATGTPCSGPSGASSSIRADSLAKRVDDRVQRGVALLDPGQRGLEQLGRVELAGGDRACLLAQREVLRVLRLRRCPGLRMSSGHLARPVPLGGRDGIAVVLDRRVAEVGRHQCLAVRAVDCRPPGSRRCPSRRPRLLPVQARCERRSQSRRPRRNPNRPWVRPAGPGEPASKTPLAMIPSRLRNLQADRVFERMMQSTSFASRCLRARSSRARRPRSQPSRRRARASKSIVLGKTPSYPESGLSRRRRAARWSRA